MIIFKQLLLHLPILSIVFIIGKKIPEGCLGASRGHTGFRNGRSLEIRCAEADLLQIRLVRGPISLRLGIGDQYNHGESSAFLLCKLQHTITRLVQEDKVALTIARPEDTVARQAVPGRKIDARNSIQLF